MINVHAGDLLSTKRSVSFYYKSTEITLERDESILVVTIELNTDHNYSDGRLQVDARALIKGEVIDFSISKEKFNKLFTVVSSYDQSR